MKVNGTFEQVMHMVRGPLVGRRRAPYVTGANVSAFGYIPGRESQYRVVTLETPEARKVGCLELYKIASIEIEGVSYMLIMYDDGIPEVTMRTDIPEFGMELFSGRPGVTFFSALVNREPEVRIGLLINLRDKGWQLYPVDIIEDFSLSRRGKLSVIANGCAGFLDMSDLIWEVTERAKQRAKNPDKKFGQFTLHANERVRVPERSILTRYVRADAPYAETFAVYREGVVHVYDKQGKHLSQIPELGSVRKLADSATPVTRAFVLTDDVGNEQRLEMIEVEEPADVPTSEEVPSRKPGRSGKPARKEVRRVRSGIGEAETVPRTPVAH